MAHFFKNYFSTLLFIFLLYLFYSTHSHYVGYLSGTYSFYFLPEFQLNIKEVFLFMVKLYCIVLIPFYIFIDEKSKARIVLWYIYRKIFKQDSLKIQSEEKTALLAWIVKWFFAPLMIFWLTGHIFDLVNNIYLTTENISLFSKDFLLFFNKYFFYMAFSAILFFDVVFFTLWYLLEGSIFKNKIKSVEPTFLWWFVALAAYPPINNATNTLLWWYSTDFPQFSTFYVHIFFNILILISMWIYSRASISLGLKASNLTNRWIVTSGPYKYMRHPAYTCKNLAWWMGWFPILIVAFINWDIKTFIYALISLSGWSYIYYLRAKTEENHLSADPDYIAYKKQVPNMFVPKLKRK